VSVLLPVSDLLLLLEMAVSNRCNSCNRIWRMMDLERGGKKKEKIAPFCTLRIHYNLAVLFFFLLFILTDAPPLEPNPKTLAQIL